jgi:Protein of unknown function (DUF3168)
MTLTLLPNAEALVSEFLRDQAEVVALVSDRVYTALPFGVEFPAVRVVQYDTEFGTHQPLWVAAPLLQIDCWGGTKAQAWTLAATCMAALSERIEGGHTHGVVSGVRFSSWTDMPDTDYEPARPRFFFTAQLTVHPTR